MKTGRDAMNHQEILQGEIVERYLKGRLVPEEAARFEEHYLSCDECLDRLALEESLARGFKSAAGQEVARQVAGRQLAFFTWLSRLSRSRQIGALAMTLLAFVLLPTVWMLRGQTRGREERQRWLESEARLEAAARRLEGELASSRGEIEREREARTVAEEQLRAAREPQGNVPILFLDIERGAGEPTHRVRLPARPGWIVLALSVEPPYRPQYRIVLQAADGRELWQGSGLKLSEMETLSLSLPSSLLAPGDYSLEVEDRRFTFRVLPVL